MHILVTGANGFVGKHLVRELLSHGHTVTGLIEHGGEELPDVHCLPFEISDLHEVARLVSHISPEACIHLAGLAYVPSATRHPKLAIDVNITGTIHILQAFREKKPAARILTITSSEIYGRRKIDDCVTEKAYKDPDTVYGITKLSADLASSLYAKQYGMNVMIARPENHIGPGQSSNFVTSAFAKRLVVLSQEAPPHKMLTGNLESLRDFTDVRDVVRAYRLLIEKGKPGEPYNIASGKLRPVRDILDGLMKVSNIFPEVSTDPALYRPSDSSHQYDTRKIFETTGWQPEIPLEKTLRDVYADFLERAQLGR